MSSQAGSSGHNPSLRIRKKQDDIDQRLLDMNFFIVSREWRLNALIRKKLSNPGHNTPSAEDIQEKEMEKKEAEKFYDKYANYWPKSSNTEVRYDEDGDQYSYFKKYPSDEKIAKMVEDFNRKFPDRAV